MAQTEQVLKIEPQHELKFRGELFIPLRSI